MAKSLEDSWLGQQVAVVHMLMWLDSCDISSRRLNNLHLSQQDPEVLLDACEDADMQLDGMMIDDGIYRHM